MAKIPTPYRRGSDDTPECVLTFTRGSNNKTRATIRVYEYPNGDVCVQLEDKLGGAELWGEADDLLELAEDLAHVAADLMEKSVGSQEG